MNQLCSRCKKNLVEFYPEEENFDSEKKYTVYCDECKADLDEERIEDHLRRGNIEGIHFFDDRDF